MRKFISLFTFILISFFCYGQDEYVIVRDTVALNTGKVVVFSKVYPNSEPQMRTETYTRTKHIPTGYSIIINGKQCQFYKDTVYTYTVTYYDNLELVKPLGYCYLDYWYLDYEEDEGKELLSMSDEEILNYNFTLTNRRFAEEVYDLLIKKESIGLPPQKQISGMTFIDAKPIVKK